MLEIHCILTWLSTQKCTAFSMGKGFTSSIYLAWKFSCKTWPRLIRKWHKKEDWTWQFPLVLLGHWAESQQCGYNWSAQYTNCSYFYFKNNHILTHYWIHKQHFSLRNILWETSIYHPSLMSVCIRFNKDFANTYRTATIP